VTILADAYKKVTSLADAYKKVTSLADVCNPRNVSVKIILQI